MAAIYEGEIDWNQIEANWRLEDELKSRVPRRVRAREKSGGCGQKMGDSCLGCVMFFMWLIGLMLTLWAGFALLSIPFGFTTQGVVTKHEFTGGGAKTSYFLHFRFRPPSASGDYSGEWPVGEDFYRRTRDGQKVTVRYFALAPGIRPSLENGVSPWLHILGLGPIGILLLSVSSLILAGFLLPKQGRFLVKFGLATPALVVKKDASIITFYYRVNGQTFEKTTTGEATTGDILTVLYFRRWPRRARLYQNCDFVARERNSAN